MNTELEIIYVRDMCAAETGGSSALTGTGKSNRCK